MPDLGPAVAPDRLEGGKQVHDSLKHMTTLSSGAIVLAAALLEKLFAKPEARWLIAATIVAFVLSLFAGVTGMILQSIDTLNTVNTGRGRDQMRILTCLVLAFYAFFGGVLILAAFFLKNLF